MENFAMNERIDDLWLALLAKLVFSSGDIKDVVKKLLVLSYGNACVESWFSISF